MVFPYYRRLSKADQATYRRSDEVRSIPLPDALSLQPLARAVEQALATGERTAVLRAARDLSNGVTRALGLPPVRLEVLDARPSSRTQELHGLYTLPEQGRARIQVWMRTAKQGRVVAWKTFLRTLLHELCHHIDFTSLDLDPSFHTEGFFRRESSLFHQLVPAPDALAEEREP